MAEAQAAPSDQVFSRALGEELRKARETCGWTRVEMCERLPSGIGDRTLLSYEHGARHFSVLRLVELGRALGVDGAALLNRALLRAGDYVVTMTLHVDLTALLRAKTRRFRPLAPWARNLLSQNPGGVVEVEPLVVANLAMFVGCAHRELAEWLAQFTPE